MSEEEKVAGPVGENADELMAHILELQTKLKNIEAQQAREELPKEKFPLAEVIIKVDKSQTSVVKNCTPAKLAILVAMHNSASGGIPIHAMTLNSVLVTRMLEQAEKERDPARRASIKATAAAIETEREEDPLVLRRELMLQFTPEKVKAMYPGAVPSFPKTFRAAISAGMETTVEGAGLFTMDLAKG